MTILFYLWDTTTYSKTDPFMLLDECLPVRYDSSMGKHRNTDLDMGWSYLYATSAEFFGWSWYSPPPMEQLTAVSLEELLEMDLPNSFRSLLLRDL